MQKDNRESSFDDSVGWDEEEPFGFSSVGIIVWQQLIWFAKSGRRVKVSQASALIHTSVDRTNE